MTATASVWNLQASIEFLYLTTLKIVILILLSLIQSMLNHRKVKTDFLDSIHIAELFQMGEVQPSYMPN